MSSDDKRVICSGSMGPACGQLLDPTGRTTFAKARCVLPGGHDGQHRMADPDPARCGSRGPGAHENPCGRPVGHPGICIGHDPETDRDSPGPDLEGVARAYEIPSRLISDRTTIESDPRRSIEPIHVSVRARGDGIVHLEEATLRVFRNRDVRYPVAIHISTGEVLKFSELQVRHLRQALEDLEVPLDPAGAAAEKVSTWVAPEMPAHPISPVSEPVPDLVENTPGSEPARRGWYMGNADESWINKAVAPSRISGAVHAVDGEEGGSLMRPEIAAVLDRQKANRALNTPSLPRPLREIVLGHREGIMAERYQEQRPLWLALYEMAVRFDEFEDERS